ncbi:MAG: diguanylate cyclase [Pseudomonadota bacterium]|nr:diguanylate cyclase [Pseudomonadota bacterium]
MHSTRRQNIRKVYRVRTIGLILGALPVCSVLAQHQTPAWLWAWMASCALLWPPVARVLTSHAEHPAQREAINFRIDAALGSSWVVFMHFNVLTSVVLLSMLSMEHLSMGGWEQFRSSLPAQFLAALAAIGLVGFHFDPLSTMWDVVACVPLLLLFPAHLSLVTFAMAKHLREQNRKLTLLSRTDALTQLPNRTAIVEASERELLRFRRNRRQASLILIDVDGLKQVNDVHGHAAGDALLRKVAYVLCMNNRDGDVAGRLSGDEFAVLLPETDVGAARLVGERIRLHGERVGAEGPGVWTLSIGIAETSMAFDDAAAWFHDADVALYLAKSQGRNRVELTAPPAAAEPSAAVDASAITPPPAAAAPPLDSAAR